VTCNKIPGRRFSVKVALAIEDTLEFFEQAKRHEATPNSLLD
jgi:hypothetical protein